MTDNHAEVQIATSSVETKGFYYGYVIVLVGFLILVVAYGAQFSFGVFFKPVLSEFGWTRAETSGAYSLYMLIQGLWGIFAGRLSDRFGARRVVTLCGVSLGLGYLLMSQTSALWQVYLFYGVFSAVGAGGCWVPLLSSVARWFDKRRGLMSGIIAAGIGVGTVIAPPVVERLISYYNWRIAYAIVGAIALVVSVSAAQFLRRDPNQTAQLARGFDAVKATDVNPGMQGLSLAEAVGAGQFWLMCVFFFLFGAYVQTVMVHMVPHATDIGISATAAAMILSIIGAMTVIGKIGLGGIADRLGNKRPTVAVFILAMVAFLWLQVADELWMLYLFAAVFGFAYGGFAALQSPMTAEFFGLRAHGLIFGIVHFGALAGGSVGPLMAGGIYDKTGSYYLAFIVLAIISAVAVVLALLLKPVYKGLKHEIHPII